MKSAKHVSPTRLSNEVEKSRGNISPNIVAYRRQGELRPISAVAYVAILGSHWTGGAVRAAQAIHADDEEPRHIKGSPVATKQWAPPVAHVGTACQSMAYDHSIVAVWRQLAFGGI